MKLPDWNRKFQSWDQYEAFHIAVTKTTLTKNYYYSSPLFIMFDTGELICRAARPTPWERGDFPSIGVSVRASGDDNLPTLYTPDGEEIKKAWLKDGGWRWLLIDEDTKRVVQLDHTGIKGRIPTRFEGRASAYFPGSGTNPVGGPVKVSKPNKMMLTKDEIEHIVGMKASIQAAAKLDPEHAVNQFTRDGVYYWNRPTNVTVEELLKIRSVNDFDTKKQWALLNMRVRRKVTEYPYLLTEKP